MKSEESFLTSLEEVEHKLNKMGFIQSHFERKGYAIFTDYKRQDTTVKFMRGPSEWHVEMFIITPKRRYRLNDLLIISVVAEWVKENKFSQGDGNYIKSELFWFVNLLEFVLPFLK